MSLRLLGTVRMVGEGVGGGEDGVGVGRDGAGIGGWLGGRGV